MKKKFAAFLFTAVLLCACLCGSAFAADGNVHFAVVVEPRYPDLSERLSTQNDNGWNTRIYCRNETGKTIQTETWEADLYSTTVYPYIEYRITDGSIRPNDGFDIYEMQTVETTQVVPPFQVAKSSDFWIRVNFSAPFDSPFRRYRTTDYVFIVDQTCYNVFQDLNGKYFIQTGDASTGTYLTEDEVQNALFPVSTSILIKNTAKKNQIATAKLTFEDGTVEEFSFKDFQNPMQTFQNPPYDKQN